MRQYKMIPIAKASAHENAAAIATYTGITWPVACVLLTIVTSITILLALKLALPAAVVGIFGVILQGILPPIHYHGLVVPNDEASLNEVHSSIPSDSSSNEP